MTRLVVKGLVWSLVLAVAAGIASVVAERHVQPLWVVGAVLAVCVLLSALGQLRRLRVSYAITSRRVAVETGLFARDLQETGLDRIQNITVRQTLMERALGVGTVRFDTAGEMGYDFSFRGVDDPRRIVRLVDRALQRRHEDRVPGMARRR